MYETQDISKRLSALSPAKRALLEKRLRGDSLGAVTSTVIPRVTRDRPLPLSFAQERLWLLEQIEPGNIAYNRPTLFSLTGQLDVAVLQRSLDEIVRRHETLRTTFATVDGSPVQVIASDCPVNLRYVDLSEMPLTEGEAETRRLLIEEARQPFDLVLGPLLRAVLIRLAEDRHWLLLTVHQIVFDDRSVVRLQAELALLYRAFLDGVPSSLAELPIQYADFATWQRDWLQGETLDRLTAYWKNQLRDRTTLAIPTDRPRPGVQSFAGSRQSLVLSEDLGKDLKALSQQQNVTMFMTLLSAFQALLHRYSGQDDIVVGSPIAGRTRPETEDLIGLFVNNLILCTDLSGDPTFLDLLERVRQVTLAAHAHQDMPFEKLMDIPRPDSTLNRTPLCQVTFQSRSEPVVSAPIQGLTIGEVEFDFGIARFDLSLEVIERPEGLTCTFEYNTGLFDATTISRMMNHYRTLLESITSDPRQRISTLSILTETERHQLLVEWNDTKAEYPTNKTVHQLFEEQVERTPDAVAVISENQRLTYKGLNSRANQLAHHLRDRGVGPETIVGICVDRSQDMIIGLLGILKAGGAYLPLDPAHPTERLRFMLRDAGVSIVVTQRQCVEQIEGALADISHVDIDGELINRESGHNSPSPVKPDNLACVLYTSGSTGEPKGVMIEHHNIVNHLWGIKKVLLDSGVDHFLFVSSFTFVTSLKQLFAPLLSGGTVRILPAGLRADPLSIIDTLANEKNIGLNCTVSLWRSILDTMETNGRALPAGSLGFLLVGGEQLSPDLIERTLDTLPWLSFWNQYGSTEVTAGVTSTRILPGDRPSIGRPTENSMVYILDAHGQPVPIGVRGELYIGGASVARGYLNRPELTAERFVPDFLSSAPGSRLYRTGDLARYLPDGNIEFLGRADRQVKLRGIRIELGEVESNLKRHPSVLNVAVVARQFGQDDTRLVAYVVLNEDRPLPSNKELRDFLKRGLPDYMVPSVFVTLPRLPQTASGKIDYRGLPAPTPTRSESDRPRSMPQTTLERQLVEAWALVLGTDQVGIDDDFFELGGHSLLAAQIVNRLRRDLQIDIPITLVLENPTIAKLAAATQTWLGPVTESEPGLAAPVTAADVPVSDGLAKRRQEFEATELVPFEATSESQPVDGVREPAIDVPPEQRIAPASFAQERLWFFDQLEPGSHAYNIQTAVHMNGTLLPEVLERSLAEIVRRHEALRTNIRAVDGRPVQVITPTRLFRLPCLDLSEYPQAQREAQLARIATEQAQDPFDLAKDSLIRTSLIRMGDEEHVLLITVHHIVFDGWSMRVLLRELASLYEAFSREQPSPLPELPMQYADYSRWQRQWQRGDIVEKQMTYWRRQLSGPLPLLEMPTDRPRPAIQTYQGARQVLHLSEMLTESLKTLSRQEGVTLFMTLLAAFQTLLHRYTGQVDIIVGAPIAGRTRTETEGMIGFFVNTLALRTDLSGDPSFREMLSRVREVALEGYAHQDVPFEKIVEDLRPERSLSYTPLFQVMLNMQQFTNTEVSWPGLVVEIVKPPEVTSKFDITLYVRQRGQQTQLELVYNADLFDRDRMIELLEQFQSLLRQISDNPSASVSSYSLLSQHARQVLPDPTEVLPVDSDVPVHVEFSRQAARVPAKEALVDCMGAWTYAQLDTLSNQLAAHLHENGINPGDIVAVYGQRCASLVWAILGILKAGAAFTVLDPAHPTSRLIDCLRIAEPRGLLWLAGHGVVRQDAETLAAAVSTPCTLALPIEKTAAQRLLSAYPSAYPSKRVSPDDPAYVMFTSGSTGQPNAVLGTHRPLSHFVKWQTSKFALSDSDRFSMLSGLSHDPLLRDIFSPLSLGATLCIPQQNDIGDPTRLTQWLAQSAVSVIHTTPALARLITEGAAKTIPTIAALTNIRYVFFGGDLLTKRDVSGVAGLAPLATLVNFYGTTETPQAMGYFVVLRPGQGPDYGDDHLVAVGARQGIPVGKGIDGVQLLVVNTARQLAGIGEVGEICVRTPYLTQGYLGDKALTAERFIKNPFTRQEGDRLYRTGDLGRYLPSGDVEFIGRLDDQVKIRGFRVEPREVESVLRQLPAVKEVAVVVREDAQGEKELGAYLVPNQRALSPEVPRSFLNGKLPHYTVPAFFVMLDTLPLTPNGKLDYQALPAPTRKDYTIAGASTSPRTTLEATLASIWSDLLPVDTVGIDDNFFDLGGHSLLAVRLFTEIEKATGKRLPLATLFQAPTIRQLADILRQEGWSPPWQSLVPIKTSGSRPPFFCVHAIDGSVVYYHDLASHLGPDQPLYGLQAVGIDGEQPPMSRIEDIAAHYLREVRSVQPNGPYHLGGFSSGGTIAFEMAQQLHAVGEAVAILVIFDHPARLPVQPRRLIDVLGPKPMASFCMNTLYLLADFWRENPEDRAVRIRRLWKRIKIELANLAKPRTASAGNTTTSFSDVVFTEWISQFPEPRRRVAEALRAALHTYTPHAYKGQVTLFRARTRPLLHRYQPDLGWARLAVDGVSIVVVPGRHRTMLKEPHVKPLASRLEACLRQAQMNSGLSGSSGQPDASGQVHHP